MTNPEDRLVKLKERNLNDIRKVLSMPEGRRFLWRVLSVSGMFQSSFTGNSTTFFNEGRRDVGLYFLNEINMARTDAFSQMQREHLTDSLAEELVIKSKEVKENDEI